MKEKISHIITKCDKKTRKVLLGLANCLVTVVWTILWIPMAFKYAMDNSYFPEQERKNVVIRILENVWWAIRYHRANGFYMLYGLDLKGSTSKGYIDENSFWKKLNALNYSNALTSQVCLLRDKLMFYKYMNENLLPVPEVFGVIRDGKLYSENLNEQFFDSLKNETDYFIKDMDGECASFVKHIATYDDLKKVLSNVENGSYILQKSVHQSKEMDKLNPDSINTLRIITVNSGGEIKSAVFVT